LLPRASCLGDAAEPQGVAQSMWCTRLFSGGSIATLEQLAAFTEARHRVLANNIANVDTPGFKARDLSPEAFEQQLRRALGSRPSSRAPLVLESSSQVWMDGEGRLAFAPQEVAHNHVLFHDENNRSVEKMMASMAKNQMIQQVSTRLLAHEFQMLQLAVRGRP